MYTSDYVALFIGTDVLFPTASQKTWVVGYRYGHWNVFAGAGVGIRETIPHWALIGPCTLACGGYSRHR